MSGASRAARTADDGSVLVSLVNQRARPLFLGTLLLLFLIPLAFGNIAHAQSLSTIKIGDRVSQLETLGVPPVAQQKMGPHTAIRFELPDGNSLSATYRNSDGVIVFVESDWGGKQSGSFTDLREFKFGSTSLNEIRKAFGHNGMAFVNGPSTAITDEGDLVNFNSYEIAKSSVVVTVITTITAERLRVMRETYDDEKAASLIGDEAKLESVIIADMEYLSGIWGSELMKDKYYKEISW